MVTVVVPPIADDSTVTIVDEEKTKEDETHFKHVCELCQRRFLKNLYLQRHMKTIHKDGVVKVRVCVCAYLYNSYLQQKITVHACQSCTMKFDKKSRLKRHMRVHTGEKPYACDTCDKTFANMQHLQRHKRVRLFVCL
jgi:uncharacterized Zn-finger protein